MFDIDGDLVMPLDVRTKLMFADVGFGLGYNPYRRYPLSSDGLKEFSKRELADAISGGLRDYFTESYLFTYHDPVFSERCFYKKNFVEFAEQFQESTVIVQQKTTERLRGRYVVSTEELGKLICMLYFREEGYIVQQPDWTYGKTTKDLSGVDDVMAWRSPLLQDLREFGFVEEGCHISELACLRWLKKPPTSRSGVDSACRPEVILAEVESTLNHAIGGRNCGVRQLLRAAKDKVAKGLFISFPFVEPLPQEELDWIDENGLGRLLFSDEKVVFSPSKPFEDGAASSEVDKYEGRSKRMLLNNFYPDEVAELAADFDLDPRREVRIDTWDDLQNDPFPEIPARELLKRIDRFVAGSERGASPVAAR
ncbi:MAG: hypothetical protein QUS33_08620 [Dehalococcoidia bacterium]|nr:hypothetical protein [Dehalococcoidia bacterium]